MFKEINYRRKKSKIIKLKRSNEKCDDELDTKEKLYVTDKRENIIYLQFNDCL